MLAKSFERVGLFRMLCLKLHCGELSEQVLREISNLDTSTPFRYVSVTLLFKRRKWPSPHFCLPKLGHVHLMDRIQFAAKIQLVVFRLPIFAV